LQCAVSATIIHVFFFFPSLFITRYPMSCKAFSNASWSEHYQHPA
jgi:hypothetical protein